MGQQFVNAARQKAGHHLRPAVIVTLAVYHSLSTSPSFAQQFQMSAQRKNRCSAHAKRAFPTFGIAEFCGAESGQAGSNTRRRAAALVVQAVGYQPVSIALKHSPAGIDDAIQRTDWCVRAAGAGRSSSGRSTGSGRQPKRAKRRRSFKRIRAGRVVGTCAKGQRSRRSMAARMRGSFAPKVTGQ